MAGADSQYQSTSIESLSGVGPKFLLKLNNMGLKNIFDLILDLPYRFEDKTFISKIAEISYEGQSVLLDAKVAKVYGFVDAKTKIFKLAIKDESGVLDVVFYNAYGNFIQNYTIGKRVLFFGNIKYNSFENKFFLAHPETYFLNKDDKPTLSKTLTPIYHLTDKIAQSTMRKFHTEAIEMLKLQPIKELLPKEFNIFNVDINEAILNCHNPYPNKDRTPFILEDNLYFKRLVLEELIAYQLSLLKLKDEVKSKNAIAININESLHNDFINSLQFKPTKAQIRVCKEIFEDISKETVMQRLVHGDVGSGKTLVAILSALQVCSNNKQVVVLAPTEILAKQHFFNFKQALSHLNINVAILYSQMNKKERSTVLENVKDGFFNIIIGTHSVFSHDVKYNDLALCIIDEHHRFGVNQIESLLSKSNGYHAHELYMSATPIPRTLQLSLYADFDVSIIDELPPNRIPVNTTTLDEVKRDLLIERLVLQCKQGVQAYWVCPHIEENENEGVSSVKETFEYIKQKVPFLNIGLVHGQMSSQQKNAVLDAFIQGHISILVATTIIEVGVNVPNASVMVIESANTLGLAQLHQLRGRVGRGSRASFCILMYNNDKITDIGRERLKILKENNDGFVIANKDLELRGPGEVVGGAQSGFVDFKLADIQRDHALALNARESALEIIKDTDLTHNLIQRWFPHYLKL